MTGHRRGRPGWHDVPSDTVDLVIAATLPAPAALRAWDRWSGHHDLDTAGHDDVAVLPAVTAHLAQSGSDLGVHGARLRGLRRRAWVDTELRCAAAIDAAGELNRCGIVPMVTGPLARAVHAATKPGSVIVPFIGFVVAGSSFAPAASCLTASGWTAVESSDRAHVRRLRRNGDTVVLYRWSLFPTVTSYPDDHFERSSTTVVRGATVVERSAGDEFVAVSAAPPVSGAVTRRLLDVVETARRVSAEGRSEWDTIRAHTPPDVAANVAAALRLCAERFDVDVPDSLAPALEDRSRRRVRLPRELERYRRHRAVSKALGRSPSPIGYAAGRARDLRRVGVGEAVSSRLSRR